MSRRVLLAGAAAFLAIGIWTMHFVGMLAAPIPADTVYLVLPTIVSFLICALVVGVSLFFLSIGEPSQRRVISSAVLLGAGIVSMHYVGIHGLAGNFAHRARHPDDPAVDLDRDRHRLWRPARVPRPPGRHPADRKLDRVRDRGIGHALHRDVRHAFRSAVGGRASPCRGLAASPQILSVVVAVLCFVIAAGFLLSLVPDPRRQTRGCAAVDPVAPATVAAAPPGRGRPRRFPRLMSAPLGGLGQPPRPAPAPRLPVEGADGTHFIDTADVRSVRADAHYTRVHDGTRERMCPWSISEAEAQLDPGLFVRVHRSHIVAMAHVSFVRKEGDGAVIELDGPSPHRVPVSRAKIAEVKARLGLARRNHHA